MSFYLFEIFDMILMVLAVWHIFPLAVSTCRGCPDELRFRAGLVFIARMMSGLIGAVAVGSAFVFRRSPARASALGAMIVQFVATARRGGAPLLKNGAAKPGFGFAGQGAIKLRLGCMALPPFGDKLVWPLENHAAKQSF